MYTQDRLGTGCL